MAQGRQADLPNWRASLAFDAGNGGLPPEERKAATDLLILLDAALAGATVVAD